VTDSIDAVWENAADHDLVVIATPNEFHVPLALQAVDLGLPVVVDKPLAANAADARRLAEAADGAGVPAAVFHERRWDGAFMTARRLVEAGELGRVARFESRFERWRPEPELDTWRERAGSNVAGGVLFDLGPHAIDQALALFGPVARVYAEVDRRRADVAVDDDSFVALTHENGVHSHLWMSLAAAGEAPRLRVLGSIAAYTKWGPEVQDAALRAGESPLEPGWGREEPGQWGTVEAGDDVWPVETEPGAWQRFYELMAEYVRSGGPPPVSLWDGVAVLEIIEAALLSATSGEVVALSVA